VIHRNGTRTNLRISVLVAALALTALRIAHAQPNPQKDIERVIRDFLVAFSNRDYAAFVRYFAEDATVFFPPSAAAPLGRVQGRSEIERTFKTIFDAYPPRSNRPPTPIAPQDLLIQESDGHAVVTFQLGSETARQRRTLVLRRIGTNGRSCTFMDRRLPTSRNVTALCCTDEPGRKSVAEIVPNSQPKFSL
jgi:hypothetical protein